MPRCIRHCVECPNCRTRYLVAFSPYSNGSYVISTLNGSSQAFILYCSCEKPQVSSQWKSSELKRYVVSSPAYQRGYGTPEEVVADGEMKKANLPPC